MFADQGEALTPDRVLLAASACAEPAIRLRPSQ